MALEPELLADQIKSAIIFFIAMLVTTGIAYYKGFYKLDKEDDKINLPTFYAFSVFLIYSFFYVILPLMLVKLLKGVTITIGIGIFLTLANSLLTLIVLYIFCYKRRKEITYPIIKRGSNNCKSDAILGSISWLIAFPVVSFFASISDVFIYTVFKVKKLPEQTAIQILKSTMAHPFYFILAVIAIVIIAPILEEFFFRGVLQNFIKRFCKRKLAIFLTSIIFALVHFSYSQKLTNITIIGSIFILGLFLSFVYEKQKSLIAPIFLHATFNAITVLNLLFFKDV